MKIRIPDELIDKLGPEYAMDIHIIDVKLRNGTIVKDLIVRGGRYIAQFKAEASENVDFISSDIVDIRPVKTLKRLFNIW